MGIGSLINIPWKLLIKHYTSKMKSCGHKFSAGKGMSIVGATNIEVGDYFSAGRNLSLETYERYNGALTGKIPKMVIGSHVSVMDNCAFSCMDRIEIGDGCLFGANVFITDNFHGSNSKAELMIPPQMRKLSSKGAVVIGKNVWLGRNVCVMPGVKIGDYSVVGANAVVTHDIPEGCIAAGVPAKIIRRVKE